MKEKMSKTTVSTVADVRRPYAKPRVLSSETLEVFAATCTQPTSKPDPILCPSGPPQS